jgi:enoyl-CoA hydratase/carnithine racemase
VGTARALELVLTGGIIRGLEAAKIGLVNYAVPADEVLPRAIAIAAAMIDADPAVLAAAKRAIRFGASATMEAAMANEQRESAALRARRSR